MRKLLFALYAATITIAGYALQGEINNNVVTQRTDDQTNTGKTTGLTAIPGGAYETGTFRDTRDGQTYKWVRIGDQVWMAENLNFASTGSWCYDNNAINCDHYGRLYTWDAAMNGASSSDANPSGVQGICPTGWHVPSEAEWMELVNHVVSLGYPDSNVANSSGNALRACQQVGSPLDGCNTSEHPRWSSHGRHHGFDAFGFSALPGGCSSAIGRFYALGNCAFWWSSTESASKYAWHRAIYYDHGIGPLGRGGNAKADGFSLRCVRDFGRAEKNPFWGDGSPFFDVQQVFSDERFPNVVVATDGTVVASWGSRNFRVRRSEDGGKNWGPEISIANPGFQGGGTTVDENTGDILVFVEDKHPPAPLTVYRSKDHGITWQADNVLIHPDVRGNMPSMHMNEGGITLKYGKHAGRLIRPTRVYTTPSIRDLWPETYTNAMYSDDGGKTWFSSAPFPAFGTGEAALEELSDGSIYYNSRRHWAPEGVNTRNRWIAWSDDGGKTWQDLEECEQLPDGVQTSDYGLMGGLVRLPLKHHDILLFSNVISDTRRVNGYVWASFDGGITWPVKRQVDEDVFAYSSLAAGRAGTPSEGLIFLFYESEDGAKMARFNLAWLTGGKDWQDYIDK